MDTSLQLRGIGNEHIGVIAEERYLAQEMPARLIRAIQAQGISVDVITPENCLFCPRTGEVHDLVNDVKRHIGRYAGLVSRNNHPVGLGMLAYADTAGVPAINTYVSLQRVRNKARMASMLEQARVPFAKTFVTGSVRALARVPMDEFPLVLKPGYDGATQNLQLVKRAEDLEGVTWNAPVVMAQRYLPNDGTVVKLCVCDTHVFAIRKPSFFDGDPASGAQSMTVSRQMTEIAKRCGQVFGLEIFGIDAIETENGLVVIDVHDFPNFTGIPQAETLLCEFILNRISALEIE